MALSGAHTGDPGHAPMMADSAHQHCAVHAGHDQKDAALDCDCHCNGTCLMARCGGAAVGIFGVASLDSAAARQEQFEIPSLLAHTQAAHGLDLIRPPSRS